MPDIAFANGVFLPLAEATVSVEDRGYQFGDGVYELLRVYGGVPLRPLDHLARLERSARALGIALPFDTARWTSVHTYSVTLVPTVVITVRALTPPAESLYTDGTDIVTVPDLRWSRCDIKSLNLLANVLAKQQARNAGAFEAVFVRDGFVLEGATSNVMAVHRGSLVTPPEGPLLLSGVTRHLTLQLAREAGISIAERPLTEAELYTAAEVLLTGTTIEILPVGRINGRCIGEGFPGPITKELMARFRKLRA